jgi:hypothetical protein
MKKQLLSLSITAVITMFTINLSAQGLYVNANVGYGFKLGSTNISGFTKVQEYPGPSNNKETQINVSLGKGMNFGAAVGYMFNKNIGAELGVSYLLGLKTKAITDHSPSITMDETTMAGRMLRINPAFVVAAGFDKVNPYAKFGVIVGIGSVINEFSYEDNIDKYYHKRIDNGGVAFGFNAAAGVMFNLSEMISIFGEANMVNLSYAPTKGTLKKDTYNGVDQMGFLTTRNKETEFVKSIDYNDPTPDSEPRKVLREKYAFGSVGINVGVRINL